MSRPFGTNIGVKQSDPLAAIILLHALRKIVRDAPINCNNTIVNKSSQLLDYADDIILVSRTTTTPWDNFLRLVNAAKKKKKKLGLGLGLHVN